MLALTARPPRQIGMDLLDTALRLPKKVVFKVRAPVWARRCRTALSVSAAHVRSRHEAPPERPAQRAAVRAARRGWWSDTQTVTCPRVRSAGFIVLAVMAEGCGDLVRSCARRGRAEPDRLAQLLEEDVTRLLNLVFDGMRDPSPAVCAAACATMSNFAEELQEELVEFHPVRAPPSPQPCDGRRV
jgi:hypothetical protein